MRESKGVTKPGGEMKVSTQFGRPIPGLARLLRRRWTAEAQAGSCQPLRPADGSGAPSSRRCVNAFRGAGRGLVAKRPRGLEPRDPAGKYLRAHKLGPERW